ncbi:GNAT family N-acetyltransferase [Anianabacter salinae]|uniref:GNAT family N-acetyltransferase n=1 Tax=Anianabacter salinae TaxID=2851023 RepID=UPI00225E14AA|nr:GNAT family N-acetyltransferase [Anianabacter salinae]MBV0910963.1 GNAT family N-acetyltransferase [Anianabacter salinae]
MTRADITLHTERLLLRRPDARDADAATRFFVSDRAKLINDYTEAQAWRAFAAEIGHWEIMGFGMFAVCQRSDPDTALGLVGPWFPPDWPETEIGWMMFQGSEGKGFAHEAAEASLRFAFDTLGWAQAVSYIDPANARSIALAERLGAVRDDACARPEPHDLVYRHDPALWRSTVPAMETTA